jgi:two-component system, NarL family, response regulator NreC
MTCDITQQSHEGLRVLVADDHPILRDGLKAILKEKNMQVVGEVSDGLQAIKLCEELAPDVAVVDVSMPLLNGIDAAREIRKVSPKTKIMILTMHTEERYVAAALRVGVSGYILKSKAASTLTQAIDAAIGGEVYIGPCVSKASSSAYLASETPTESLSGRERGVLQLIAERKNVKEVGDLLGISTKTAESHRANIMRKLGIHDIAGLVRHAIKEGLTHID